MASYRFYNILKTQESTSIEGGPIGINICSLISSLEIITSGLKRIKLIFWKPTRIFSSLKVAKNVVWK